MSKMVFVGEHPWFGPLAIETIDEIDIMTEYQARDAFEIARFAASGSKPFCPDCGRTKRVYSRYYGVSATNPSAKPIRPDADDFVRRLDQTR